ncbi:hypothetical protein ACS0TY_004370 [Phlomoides rotata]
MADSRLIRPFPKPLQLRDYLLDDMSSCSSNGFKSFPRRSQCCTTVRFLHEFDRKIKHDQKIYLMSFNGPPPKPALSALQTVIAAVRRIQFTAKKSPEKKISFLPRSFSKKIFLKTFWKRKSERKEIARWKSFDQLLKEDAEPSDRSITTTDSKSKRWSGSDFTASTDSSDCPSMVNLDLPEESNDEAVTMPMEVVSVNGVGVPDGDVSTDSTTCSNQSADDTNSKKQWSSEEKEQFSPVSVLDCPFDDEDEVSSPFQHRLDRMEGTKKKLLKKIQMFECLAKLEPVNLNTRFALEPDSDAEEEQEEEEEEEEKALALLRKTKASMPPYALKLKADKLLLDFFKERIVSEIHEGLIEEAEDWIYGRKTRGSSFIEWGVQKFRESFVRDMEKGGEWKALDQETEEVVIELENEVFAALLNEELLHLTI